jgi:hypothetical protein
MAGRRAVTTTRLTLMAISPIPQFRPTFKTNTRDKLPQSERQGEDRKFQQPDLAVAAEHLGEDGLNDGYAEAKAGFCRQR